MKTGNHHHVYSLFQTRDVRNRDQGAFRDEGQKGQMGTNSSLAHSMLLCKICLLLKSNIISNM